MYPVIFSIGPITLHTYGLLVAFGVLAAIFYLKSQAASVSLSPETVTDLAITTAVSGFVCARIFYVLQFWDFFKANPFDAFKIWQGGIVLYGGLIGGVLGFACFIRIRKLDFIRLLDLFVPAMALAQGFGRIGCFLNGCCFGKSCDFPWAVSFPDHAHALHPTQLYEAVFCFALAGFLIFFRRQKIQKGVTSLVYFTVYPAGRFVIEFFRGDQSLISGLTIAQWVSLGIILLSALAYLFYGKKTIHRSF